MPDSERVLVLAPVGRDAGLLARVLGEVGIVVETCSDVAAVTKKIGEGAGAVLMTEHALSDAGVSQLLEVVAGQPAWSDIPFVLLAGAEPAVLPDSRAIAVASLRGAASLTVVERPIRAAFLVTVMQAALRARQRQYELRAVLERERNARDAAERARELAEAASRAKDDFLATVSHELRTPLGAIVLWTRLLEGQRLTADEARRAIEAIGQSAQAQSELVEELLDVARTSAGKLRVELTELDLATVIEASLAIVRPAATARGLSVDVDVAPGIVFRGDPDRMQQVLVNIVGNAVKFTPAGGRISIRARSSGATVTIEVADSGGGIDDALLPSIFDRFTQGETPAARETGGLGLGLAISRQIIELHGGTVRAASAGRGRGSVFTIELPRPPEREMQPKAGAP